MMAPVENPSDLAASRANERDADMHLVPPRITPEKGDPGIARSQAKDRIAGIAAGSGIDGIIPLWEIPGRFPEPIQQPSR